MRSTDVCSSQGPLVAWHGAPHDLRRGSPLPGEVVRSLVIVVLSITVYHTYTTNGARSRMRIMIEVKEVSFPLSDSNANVEPFYCSLALYPSARAHSL